MAQILSVIFKRLFKDKRFLILMPAQNEDVCGLYFEKNSPAETLSEAQLATLKAHHNLSVYFLLPAENISHHRLPLPPVRTARQRLQAVRLMLEQQMGIALDRMHLSLHRQKDRHNIEAWLTPKTCLLKWQSWWKRIPNTRVIAEYMLLPFQADQLTLWVTNQRVLVRHGFLEGLACSAQAAPLLLAKIPHTPSHIRCFGDEQACQALMKQCEILNENSEYHYEGSAPSAEHWWSSLLELKRAPVLGHSSRWLHPQRLKPMLMGACCLILSVSLVLQVQSYYQNRVSLSHAEEKIAAQQNNLGTNVAELNANEQLLEQVTHLRTQQKSYFWGLGNLLLVASSMFPTQPYYDLQSITSEEKALKITLLTNDAVKVKQQLAQNSERWPQVTSALHRERPSGSKTELIITLKPKDSLK